MKYDFNIDTYIAFLTANGNRYSGVEASKAIGFPASSLDWTHARVRKAWLRGFGFVVVARIVFQNGDIRYVCTNDLSLTDYADVSRESKKRWTIEEFHRGIKQTTGIEKRYSVKKAFATHAHLRVLRGLRAVGSRATKDRPDLVRTESATFLPAADTHLAHPRPPPHQQSPATDLKPAVRNRHLRHEHRPKGPNRKRAADTEHKQPTTFFFHGRNEGDEDGETKKCEARIISHDTLGVVRGSSDQSFHYGKQERREKEGEEIMWQANFSFADLRITQENKHC